MAELETLEEEARDPAAAIARLKSQVRRLQAERDWLSLKLQKHERDAAAGAIQRRYPNATLAHCFSAVSRPFCAVFPPLFCVIWLPGAETERTGEKWRKMGEIWAHRPLEDL